MCLVRFKSERTLHLCLWHWYEIMLSFEAGFARCMSGMHASCMSVMNAWCNVAKMACPRDCTSKCMPWECISNCMSWAAPQIVCPGAAPQIVCPYGCTSNCMPLGWGCTWNCNYLSLAYTIQPQLNDNLVCTWIYKFQIVFHEISNRNMLLGQTRNKINSYYK